MKTEIEKWYGIINDKGVVVETSQDLEALEKRLILHPTWYQIQERHVLPNGALGKVLVVKKSDKNRLDEIRYKAETTRQITKLRNRLSILEAI
jgi:hypothetical protein